MPDRFTSEKKPRLYKTYSLLEGYRRDPQTNAPVPSEAAIELAKHEVDANEK